jgi:formylglycine-generating enzyme required for sulfatase activity
MRIVLMIACAFLAALFATAPTSAQTQQQIDACAGKGNVSQDLRIGACTAVIQSGRWSGSKLVWAFLGRGDAYYNKYDTSNNKDDIDRALQDYGQAIKLDPKSSDAFNSRCHAHNRKGQYDRAIQDCDQAIKLNPKAGGAYYGRGNAKHGVDDERWNREFDYLKARELGLPWATSEVDVKVIPAQQLQLEQEKALKPKDVFRECDACPEMVIIPAGSFTMGSPASEPQRDKNEDPSHTVTFAQNFAVGKFAVTFREWDICVADGGCRAYRPEDKGLIHLPEDTGWGRGRQPVINVSWYDAKAYVSWLSQKTGKTYRLLSESEREYVARAGTNTPFWWGPSISPQQAIFNATLPYNNGPKGERRGRPVPVDWFEPNPWGLYQVHGNIYEWVEDCWNDNYSGAPPDGSAWTKGECKTRVVRGGSWAVSPEALRSAYRNGAAIDIRGHDVGFRVARMLAQ